MARGDAFIVQNVHDALAGNAGLSVAPASGVEVCITSVNASKGDLMVVSPSDAGSGQNYQKILNDLHDNTSGALKIFINSADYIIVVGDALSSDRFDAHISGIVTKA